MLWHEPSVAIFARMLSLRSSRGYAPGEVDQDVFTPYKSDHRSGLTLSDTMSWQPYLDTLLSARLAAATNELTGRPGFDNLSASVGLRQRIGDTELAADYRKTRFFEDVDRDTPVTRSFFSGELVHDLLLPEMRRVELGLRVVKDLDRSETTGHLVASLHLGRGRGYRDFDPGGLDFLELRRQRMQRVER